MSIIPDQYYDQEFFFLVIFDFEILLSAGPVVTRAVENVLLATAALGQMSDKLSQNIKFV